MRRKSFGNMQCPIARSLERVGEWWSILILRDASLGLTRFDEFQESLGIAPNILTRRLKALVEAGLLARRRVAPSRARIGGRARGRTKIRRHERSASVAVDQNRIGLCAALAVDHHHTGSLGSEMPVAPGEQRP